MPTIVNTDTNSNIPQDDGTLGFDFEAATGGTKTTGEVPPKDTAKKTAKPKVGDPDYRSPSDKKLATSISSFYDMAAMGVSAFGIAKGDAGLLGMGSRMADLSEPTADAWIVYANENPSVKRVLTKLTEVSKMGILIGMHVGMVMPLLVDRGIVPESAANLTGVA